MKPLLFAENKGQLHDKDGKLRDDILFKAAAGNTTIYLGKTGIAYQFTKAIYPKGYNRSITAINTPQQLSLSKQIQKQTFLFSLELVGANPSAVIRKESKSNFVENFYTSGTPKDGITNVGNYERVVYENIYPNIDWMIYSKGGHLKYDFIVHPGGDAALIKLKAKDVIATIGKDGSLIMKTSLGEVNEKAPMSFADGVSVPSSFQQNEDGSIGFKVNRYSDKTLVIDPYVQWATYCGGSEQENGLAVATNSASGGIYMAGITESSTGIASGGFQNTFGGNNGYDAFLVKLDSAGNRLWATYYGGDQDDRGTALAVDASGNVYMTGTTGSSGLASGGFQNVYGGGLLAANPGDAFLVKFNTLGVRIWATYYGGSNDEYANVNGCAVDASGNVYMSGSTNSTSGIATSNGAQSVYGGGAAGTGNSGLGDAFLVKFDSAGNRLWGTYYGGTGFESGYGCTVDATGNVFLTGGTLSLNNIASVGAFQNTFTGPSYSAFLVKFNANGARLWGTYYGNAFAEGWSVTTDGTGNVYLAGRTSTTSNIASGGFQNTLGGSQDAFLAKFNASGVRLWGTYYGGSADEFGYRAFLDNSGNVYLCGQSLSTSGIASGGLQNANGGGFDAMLIKFGPAGNRIWGSYYGNTGFDAFTGGCVDALGNIYLGGYSSSTSGIALGGFQNTSGGSTDAILVKLKEVCVPDSVSITKNVCINHMPYVWNGITIPAAGTNVAKDTFINANGCDSVVYLSVVVSNPPAMTHVYDTICSNHLPFLWNNISVTLPSGNATTALYTVQGASGCDSSVTLHLFVKTASATTVNKTICSNQLPYSWNGITVTTGGNAAAVYTVPNAVGCDSVATLNLTVNNTFNDTVNISICNNQLPYVWNGNTLNAGGLAVATFATQSAAGCDSIVTLNLTVKNTSSSIVNQTICASELPYTWNGLIVTSGGNSAATYTGVNAVGCDSVVTLNLTVKPIVTPGVSITATPGNNVLLGTAVTFAATVTNAGPSPSLQWFKNGTVVGGNTALYTDLNLDSADVITCVLHGSATCSFPDTAQSNAITMTVVTPPPACLVPITLISTDIQFTSAVFKWANVNASAGFEIALDMLPGNPSSGMFTTDTAYHASALLPGLHYFHIRTRCANNIYSSWITITINIQDDNSGPTGTVNVGSNGNNISLYPNPNNGVFNIMGLLPDDKASIDIIDKTGRIVYRSDAATPSGKLNHHVDLSGNLSTGIYLLRITSGYNVYVLRFIHD